MAAAERIDALTNQPDCVDPKKARLSERMDQLAAELEKLRKEMAE